MDELKEKLDNEKEIDEKMVEEIVKVYGVENIDRLLALQNEWSIRKINIIISQLGFHSYTLAGVLEFDSVVVAICYLFLNFCLQFEVYLGLEFVGDRFAVGFEGSQFLRGFVSDYRLLHGHFFM